MSKSENNNRKTSDNKKCSEMDRMLLPNCAGALIVALIVAFIIMPSAMAQSETTVLKTTVLAQPEIRAMAMGIVSCMSDLPRKRSLPVPTVRVPGRNFAAILQEMQNQHARFLLPGSPIPPNARVVFQLESEEAGLSQTVYFI